MYLPDDAHLSQMRSFSPFLNVISLNFSARCRLLFHQRTRIRALGVNRSRVRVLEFGTLPLTSLSDSRGSYYCSPAHNMLINRAGYCLAETEANLSGLCRSFLSHHMEALTHVMEDLDSTFHPSDRDLIHKVENNKKEKSNDICDCFSVLQMGPR